ncbi:hypothetical protein BDP27DRAFT_1364679 [Rhodocollybia butyracea]|uniref:Uncharacterized protein n=1 Tax=Rhodocollybia butyracea TaxID=206335 RepID=A0A9P5PRB0_9AGAR|nr:hypothetical protein BDP27DRAFT_1364679 [Rhodocollybia butyracea]
MDQRMLKHVSVVPQSEYLKIGFLALGWGTRHLGGNRLSSLVRERAVGNTSFETHRREAELAELGGNQRERLMQNELVTGGTGDRVRGMTLLPPPFKFRALEELIAMRCQCAGTVGQPATGLSRRVEFVLRNPYSSSSSTSTLPLYNQPHLTSLEMSKDQHWVQCFRIHGLDVDMIIEMLRFCAYAHLEGISVAKAVEVLTPHGTGFTFPMELFCDALDIIEWDNSSVEVLQRVNFEHEAMFPASSKERKGLSSFIQRQKEEDPWQKTVDSEKSKRERKKDKTLKKPSIWFTIPALAKPRVPSSTATNNPVVPPVNNLPITQPESPLPMNLPQVVTQKRSFSPTPDEASRVVRPRLGNSQSSSTNSNCPSSRSSYTSRTPNPNQPVTESSLAGPAEGLGLEGQVIPATFIQAYRAVVLQLQEEKERSARFLGERNRLLDEVQVLGDCNQGLEANAIVECNWAEVLFSRVKDVEASAALLTAEYRQSCHRTTELEAQLAERVPPTENAVNMSELQQAIIDGLRRDLKEANRSFNILLYQHQEDPESPALQKAICELLADLDALPYTPTPTDSSVNYSPLPAPSFSPLSSTVPGLGTASRSNLLPPVSSQTPNSNPPREPLPMEEIEYVDLADIPGLHEEEDELEEEGEDELNEEVREVSQMAICEDVIPGQEHSGGLIPKVHVQTESSFVPNPHNPLHMNAKSGF